VPGLLERIQANRVPAVRQRSSGRSLMWPDLDALHSFQGAGYGYGGYGVSGGTGTATQERVDPGFAGFVQGGYRSNGIVWACMLARLALFSGARFLFQSLRNGRPGDLFAKPALRLLERPWPNGTTGDLLARLITDVDLAGNAYVTVRQGPSGPWLKRMRPDWVTIIMGSPETLQPLPGDDLDAQVIGYVYDPKLGGSVQGTDTAEFIPVDEAAHFAPYPDPLANYRGMSWLTPVVREIEADTAATVHKGAFFRNGATPQLVMRFDASVSPESILRFKAVMEADHEGVWNAYRTLYAGGGADPVVVGKDLQQLDFKATQGAGETRIASAAGIHPVIIGLSEGLAGSSLNAGNFNSARRLTAEKTLHHLWGSVSGSLEVLVPPPGDGSMLWYDTRHIAFLREDSKDAAEIQQIKAITIRQLIDAGYTADSVVAAVEAEDMSLLVHSGLFSVQLQAPGSTKMPVGEAPGEIPVGGQPGQGAPEAPAAVVAPPRRPPTETVATVPANGKVPAKVG
jgi:Phage portal protein